MTMEIGDFRLSYANLHRAKRKKSGFLRTPYAVYSIILLILIGILASLNINFPQTIMVTSVFSSAPPNGTVTTNTSAEIAINLTDATNLTDFRFNWNGTNYNFYDQSLVLMMNLDNVSALGENSSSTKTADVSVFGNTGTCTNMGSACNWVSGKYGNALSFDGVNDYLEIVDNLSIKPTQELSIEMWCYASLNDVRCVVSKHSSSGRTGYVFFLNSDNKFYFQAGDGSTWAVYSVSSGAISTPGWYHVVGTHNSSTHEIYVNGVQEGSGSGGTLAQNTLNLWFGRNTDVPSAYYPGTMDEIRIYNRSLTADEIKQHYLSNLNKYDTDKWQFYTNQSNLSIGIYTYFASANDTSGNFNMTDVRMLNIISNIPYPAIGFVSPTPASSSTLNGTNIIAVAANDSSGIDLMKILLTNSSGSTFGVQNCSREDNNTKLLMHMDGTDGSTTFVDNSFSNHSITVYGNAQLSTSQYKFGGASGYFDGTDPTDIQVASDSDFNLGTDDWTIDTWFYATSLTAADLPIIGRNGPHNTLDGFPVITANNGANGISVYLGTTGIPISGVVSLSTNTWYHLAVIRNGSGTNNINIFVNGTLVGQGTYASSIPQTGVVVGARSWGATNVFWNGYIDELRFSKGIARWTANFTPPNQAYHANDTNASCVWQWNTSSYSDGIYYVNATTNNTNGAMNYTGINTYIVNNALPLILPLINFVSPTPDNNTSTTNTSVQINVSINSTNLSTVIWNWNGTNYRIGLNRLALFYTGNNSNDVINTSISNSRMRFYPDPSIILAMNFDNDSLVGENATTVIDISRYGNNGTCVNSSSGTFGCNWTTNGKYYGAISFNSTNQYVTIPHNNILNGDTDLTVEFWKKPGNQATNGYDVYKCGNSACLATYFAGITSINAGWGFYNTNPTGYYVTCPGTYNDTWHYVVGVHNHSSGQIYMYIDGALCGGSVVFAGTHATGNYPLGIGGMPLDGYGPTYYMNGTIDEVRIYNRTMSAEEVTQHYYANLYKYTNRTWQFTTNQSNLSIGTYTYFASANDTSGNYNMTDVRVLNIISNVAYPSTNFAPPTPANNTFTANTNVQINVSTNTTNNLSGFIWNWNGINYTIYDNSSLTLMMNFDNVSALGENSSSTKTSDVSVFGNTGTCTNMGSACNWVSGKYGKAVSFDGSNDYIDCGARTVTIPFTFETWVKPNTWPSSAGIAIVEVSDALYKRVGLETFGTGSTNTLSVVYMGTSGNYLQYRTSRPTLGAWTHVVGVISNTSSNGGILYYNGVPQQMTFFSGGSPAASVSATCTIGVVDTLAEYPFNGTIDEVRIYNRSLTESEIRQRYISNLNKYDTNKWLFYATQSTSEPLGSQAYTYHGCANDSSGGQSCAANILNILGVPPSVNFTSPTPTDNSVLAGLNIINASASDDTSGIYSLNISITNSSSSTILMNSCSADNETKLLLHMDSINGSTTFLDSSPFNSTITPSGIAQISTAQYKSRSSAFFNGTGDYLTVPDSDDWAFGTGNFTIDFWVQWPGSTAYTFFFSQGGNPSYLYRQQLSWDGTDIVYYVANNADANTLQVRLPYAFLPNRWYHVALVRNGTTTSDWFVFVDGISQPITAPVQLYNPIPDFAANPKIGAYYDGSGSVKLYIDEFRVSKGIARWTYDFTPPNAPYYQNQTCNLTWDTSAFADGTYTVNTTAEDVSGNVNSTVNAYNLSNAPPTSCGDIITTNTVLTTDINANGSCLITGANNIIIDCNGHSMTGNGTGYGIDLIGYPNVTVKNCIISNFNKGMFVSSSNFDTILNNTIHNSQDGLYLTSSSNNTLANNTIHSNLAYGIYLYDHSSNNTVINNTVFNNTQFGIQLYSSSQYNNIISNTVYNNSFEGILLWSAQYNVLSNNSVFNNSRDGIRLSSTYYNQLYNNTAYNNSRYGISFSDGTNNLLINNLVANNSNHGIHIYSYSTNNNITNNLIVNNSGSGIYLQFLSSSNDINYNDIYNNTVYEIDNGLSNSINAIYNYWGTTDCAQINSKIFDWNDNNAYGNVTYQPFLNDTYSIGSPMNCTLPTSCGDTITSDTTLTSDLTGCNGSGLIFGVNSITLDCAGHNITGNGTGNGISSTYNSTIKNCKVSGFDQGISISGISNNNVFNNTVYNNVNAGILVFAASQYTNVTNNIAFDNKYGIHVISSSDYNNITNNIVYNNTHSGIRVYLSSTGNIVANNSASENSYYGILVESADYNSVYGNNLFKNNEGIVFYASSNNNFTNNTVFNNTNAGIRTAASSTGNNISSDDLYNNTNYEFSNEQSQNVNVSNNYWGTIDCVQINNKIYDWSNNPSYGNVTYQPFLNDTFSAGSPMNCSTGPSCGDTITANTTLTANLTGCAVNGLVIGASDVTLDCTGHTISGTGAGYGISMSSRINVTLRNCIVSNFSTAVYLEYSSNNTLVNNSIGNSQRGFDIWFSSNYNNITENVAHQISQEGITIYSSSRFNVIERNTVYDVNSKGIYLEGGSSSNNFIINNTIHNVALGIDTDSSNNMINYNIISNISGRGAHLYYVINNTLNNNNIVNASSGIYLQYSSNNTFVNNSITACIGGIELWPSSSNNTIVNNYIFGQSSYGIYLWGSSINNNISYNDIYNNTSNNMYNDQSDTIDVKNNYWGTTNCSQINAEIYDHSDDGSLGIAAYQPFLNDTYPIGTPRGCVQCGDTITTNTTLATDLTGCAGNGIVIDANDVTLDCAGHLISGTATLNSYGVLVQSNKNNTVIKNCEITNFDAGISTDTTSGDNFYNNTLYGMITEGMSISGSSGSNFYNNTFHSSPRGLKIAGSSPRDIAVYNNTFINGTGADNGLHIEGGVNLTIYNNSFLDVSAMFVGIVLANTQNSIVNSNYLNGASFLASIVILGNNNSVTNNEIYNASIAIAFVNSAQNNNVTDNYISGSSIAGIQLSDLPAFALPANNNFNNILRNNLTNNYYGIYVFNSTNNTYQDNNIVGSTAYTFYNNQTFDVNASDNYWDTTNCMNITNSIYDNQDDGSLGIVTYEPFLNAQYPAGSSRYCVQCGDTITTNTTLTSDLLNCTSSGLLIGADNVTLDCAGYSIAYTQNIGCGGPCFAVISQANNVTVKNCIIHDYSSGIIAFSVNDSIMLNNTVYNTGNNCIFAFSAQRASMLGNRISNCGSVGLLFYANSFNGYAFNNTANGSFVGLGVINSSGIFEQNILENASIGGAAFMSMSTNSTLRLNSISNNIYGVYLAAFGAFIGDSANITVEQNTISNNGIGIYTANNSINNHFFNNNIINSTTYAFYDNQSADVNASYNYWDTANCTQISNSIYDQNDDGSLGLVTYDPFLNDSYPTGSPMSCPPVGNPVIGNASSIHTNAVGINIKVAGSTNLSGNYVGTQSVEIFNNSQYFVNMNWNFSQAGLNLSALNITVQSSGASAGSTIVKGLDLVSQGQTKSMSVSRVAGTNRVCIKDAPITSISEISSACTDVNETLLNCPGTSGSYSCTIAGSLYNISGLSYSGGIEVEYNITDCNASTYNGDNIRYVLQNDIITNVTGSCLVFYGQNVTLDCLGHSITFLNQSSSSGAIQFNTNSYNATLKNCILNHTGGGRVAFFDNCANSTVINNTLYGIEIQIWQGSNNMIVTNNTVVNTLIVEMVSGLDGTRIIGNRMANYSSFGGVINLNGNNSVIQNNTFENGITGTFFLSFGSNARNTTISQNLFNNVTNIFWFNNILTSINFSNNNINKCSGTCVETSVFGSQFSGNNFTNSTGTIKFYNTTNTNIYNNNLTGLSLILQNSTGLSATNNYVSDSTQFGLSVLGCNDVNVTGNTLRGTVCDLQISTNSTNINATGNTLLTGTTCNQTAGTCGNSVCEAGAGETCGSCPTDCGGCGGPVCGNGVIEAGETCDNDGSNSNSCGGSCKTDCSGFTSACGGGTITLGHLFPQGIFTLQDAFTDAIFDNNEGLSILDPASNISDMWYMFQGPGSHNFVSENVIVWAIANGFLPPGGTHNGTGFYYSPKACTNTTETDFIKNGTSPPPGVMVADATSALCMQLENNNTNVYWQVNIFSFNDSETTINITRYGCPNSQPETCANMGSDDNCNGIVDDVSLPPSFNLITSNVTLYESLSDPVSNWSLNLIEAKKLEDGGVALNNTANLWQLDTTPLGVGSLSTLWAENGITPFITGYGVVGDHAGKSMYIAQDFSGPPFPAKSCANATSGDFWTGSNPPSGLVILLDAAPFSVCAENVANFSEKYELVITSYDLTQATFDIYSMKEQVCLPKTTQYSGNTTNFNIITDLTNATNVTIEKPNQGRISWNGAVNVAQSDFDTYVNISNNWIAINISAFNSTLNSSAEITLYNITALDTPVIHYCNDTLVFDSSCPPCPISICTNITFNTTTNVLKFNVTHFSGFFATFCGDAICQSSESCSICAADCGICPTPPALPQAQPSGGGGGPTICYINYECGDWGVCYDSEVQYRTCIDKGNCRYPLRNESRKCVPIPPFIEEKPKPLPTCSDSIKNQDETDTDCGGNICSPCRDKLHCLFDSDCAGGQCYNNICITPNCYNQIKEGSESDIDCGGPVCKPCENEKKCVTDFDCESDSCIKGRCVSVEKPAALAAISLSPELTLMLYVAIIVIAIVVAVILIEPKNGLDVLKLKKRRRHRIKSEKDEQKKTKKRKR